MTHSRSQLYVCFLDPHTVVASCVSHATSRIVLLDLAAGSFRDLGLPFLDLALNDTGIFRHSDDSIVVLGSTATALKELVLISQLRSDEPRSTTLRATTHTPLPVEYFSKGSLLEVPRSSRDGSVYAFCFLPSIPNTKGPRRRASWAHSAPWRPQWVRIAGTGFGCSVLDNTRVCRVRRELCGLRGIRA